MEQDHADAQARAAWLGPGTIVDGRFRLASVVARTASDALYNAVDERTRQRVRLRVTPHAPDPSLVRLRHPAFPSVVHHGRSGRWSYVALEWFDGEPLELPTVGVPDPKRVRAWATLAMDLLDALEHAHVTAGRAHGSLCLGSLWEGQDGRMRVIDVSGPDGPVGEEIVPYASPERLRGLPRDPRSDLYSVAAVLYALATGTPPFGLDPIEARSGHLLRRMPEEAAGGRGPILPPMFVAVLRTALEKQPHHRFATAARMRAAFGLAIREFDGVRDEEPSDTAVAAILDEIAPTDTLRPADERHAAPAEVTTTVPQDLPIDEPRHALRPMPVLVGAARAVHASEVETEIVPRSAQGSRSRALAPAAASAAEPEAVTRSPRPVRRVGGRPGWAVATVVLAGIVASASAWIAFAAGLALFAAWKPALVPGLAAPKEANDAVMPALVADAPPVAAPEQPDAVVSEAVESEVPASEVPASEVPASEVPAAEPEPAPSGPEEVPVQFVADSYEPVERATLPDFVSRVRRHDGTVRLTGHTDDRGPAESNLLFGLGRAWAVQQLLVLKGIAEQKLPIASAGETEPVADNTTPEGRAANRRVTAEFLPETP